MIILPRGTRLDIRVHRFAITDFSKPYKWYNAIMTLRVLWLKQHEPKTWKMLDILMDHGEAADKEDKILGGVVDFIRNVCKLKFTEKEIRHVLGIIDTNAYIIGETSSKEVRHHICRHPDNKIYFYTSTHLHI